MSKCGILFVAQHLARPKDADGCRLPISHEGPHEFAASDGTVYQWETDWACECDHCRRSDGDYCEIYWKKTP